MVAFLSLIFECIGFSEPALRTRFGAEVGLAWWEGLRPSLRTAVFTTVRRFFPSTAKNQPLFKYGSFIS